MKGGVIMSKYIFYSDDFIQQQIDEDDYNYMIAAFYFNELTYKQLNMLKAYAKRDVLRTSLLNKLGE